MLSPRPQCLRLLTWRELELRVCGRPTVDLAVLERHTVYSPSSYTRQSSPVIQWFWQILGEFTQDELGKFLQFCWARSRLPAEEQHESYRMQLNILDAAAGATASGGASAATNDMLLPTSETCFFNGRRNETTTGKRKGNDRDRLRRSLTSCTFSVCVFPSPVNMPKYSNLETMRSKMKMALLCSTITS